MAAARSIAAQVAMIGLEDPNDVARESDEHHLIFETAIVAMRELARELTYQVCAAKLDAIWGSKGRPVSASVLRAALEGTERNYFRFEWCIWFARHSEDVALYMREIGGAALPVKTPEQELNDLKATIREEYPKQAVKLIRKAESR